MNFRRRFKDDRGVSLVLAMVVITTISLVVAALVFQSSANVKATVGLRDQAAESRAADAAAKYAINQVRLTGDTLPDASKLCGSLSGDTTSTFNSIYPQGNGTPAYSATVVCRPASTNAEGGDPNQANVGPGNALLTLDPVTTRTGIYANVNEGAVKIRGGIFSNSRINAPGGLHNSWTPIAPATGSSYNFARGTCTGLTTETGTVNCNYAAADIRGSDPGTLTPHGASYNTPGAPGGAATISTCAPSDKIQTVTPGSFSGAVALAALNSLTGCSNGVVWFRPGRYYFDLPGLWEVPAVFLVAGTFKTANADPTKKVNQWGDPSGVTACVAPGDAGATTGSGVQFVIGGSTRIGVNTSANPGSHVTICASNSPDGPPIAIYGLKTATGGIPASAVCNPSGGPATPCSAISSGNSPKSILSIHGTTYVPNSVVDITLNNNSKKVFYWGLITRAIAFGGTGSADVSQALVDVPDTAGSPFPSNNKFYLNVFVCEGAGACSTSGTPNIQTAVRVSSLTPDTVDVLSWSDNR